MTCRQGRPRTALIPLETGIESLVHLRNDWQSQKSPFPVCDRQLSGLRSEETFRQWKLTKLLSNINSLYSQNSCNAIQSLIRLKPLSLKKRAVHIWTKLFCIITQFTNFLLVFILTRISLVTKLGYLSLHVLNNSTKWPLVNLVMGKTMDSFICNRPLLTYHSYSGFNRAWIENKTYHKEKGADWTSHMSTANLHFRLMPFFYQ